MYKTTLRLPRLLRDMFMKVRALFYEHHTDLNLNLLSIHPCPDLLVEDIVLVTIYGGS
jgi:hypothetical protein